MIDFIVSASVALLSGLGVGSRGLLVVFLTEYRGVGQLFAQGINLLFFIFSSAAATAVNLRRRRIAYGTVLLMSLGGAVGAIVGAFAASLIDPAYLRIGIMPLVGGIPTLLRSGREAIEMMRAER